MTTADKVKKNEGQFIPRFFVSKNMSQISFCLRIICTYIIKRVSLKLREIFKIESKSGRNEKKIMVFENITLKKFTAI